jgi:drug/metabolite transporter (DMT)-like permease
VTTSHGERVAVTAFVTYTVLAGGNAVGIRFSNRELAPLWGASLRFALAAGLFLAVMVVLRLAFPRGRPLLGSLLYGLFNIGAAFGLIYYGLVRVHAGLGQILLAFVPLATLLLAVLWRQEHLTVAAVIGTLLALAGVAVISRSPLQQNVPPGCNRLGGGVPAVLDRSPVLGGVAGSYGFVIIPFVTLVLSAWLDNEPVGLGLALGGLLVLAGVYVGALRAARLSRAALNVKD